MRVVTEAEQWGGVPKLLFTFGQMMSLYSYCPQWRGVLCGPPIPFGGGARAHVLGDAMFVMTREDAEAALRHHAAAACADQKMEYEADEWTVEWLQLANGC